MTHGKLNVVIIFKIYLHWIIVFYALDSYNVICQSYLSKTGENKYFFKKKKEMTKLLGDFVGILKLFSEVPNMSYII